jgi:hypothetical protein
VTGVQTCALPIYRTHQSTTNVVFHVTRDPSIRRSQIDDIARTFGIGDLRPAIADFINRLKNHDATDDNHDGHINFIGGRRIAAHNCTLPVQLVEVWTKMRLQTTSYHYPHSILLATTINALPPSELSGWTHGRFDPVVVNLDITKEWPKSGLSGMSLLIHVLIYCLRADNKYTRPYHCRALSNLSYPTLGCFVTTYYPQQ